MGPPARVRHGSHHGRFREYDDQQLTDLGFLRPARRVVDFPPGSPYYDVVYVSRHPTGVGLWNRTNPAEPPPPTLLDILPTDT